LDRYDAPSRFFGRREKTGSVSKPPKWEIYRAGRKSAIKQSEVSFTTVTEANRAGKKALDLFLSEIQDDPW
jgi:hypothetical protein